ncbi:tetratricopeptide repeat protein [Cucumibacter marinus]|uniref:tetratricopeptide repeat protein n=1 Tax=Cucumibacter marinus TaxID=1121252 RepID=UPI0006864982|nr:tetratricopeptide repeat protein [Cucumibacter marinus]
MPISDCGLQLKGMLAAAAIWAVPALAAAQGLPGGSQLSAIDSARDATEAVQSLSSGGSGGSPGRLNISINAGVSNDELLGALEAGAEAGQPLALWQLGLMYENGDGVKADKAKAFGYFSRIANDNADSLPRSPSADIVAQSFVKIGEYLRSGVPDAGIAANKTEANRLTYHAATYFGDAEAQFRLGQLYLDDAEFGYNPLQSARWLTLAARKGHIGAQATLGRLIFDGEGVERDPVEGLMWLNVAERHADGTADQAWIEDLIERANAEASDNERLSALIAADSLSSQLGL